jgi:hypothetical protein
MKPMKTRIVLAIAFAAFITPGFAKFARPEMIPVERLLENAKTHLAANPDSDETRYTLARIHYLAFARSSTSVPAFTYGDTPRIAPNWMIGKERSDQLDEAKLAAHANDALSGFRELIKKDPGNGLYQLGLASLLEQIVEWKERAKPTELSEDLKGATLDQARDAYLAAFRASFGKDSALEHQPASGVGSLVSYEAGKAFLRLASIESDASPDLSAPSKEITEGLAKIEEIPRTVVTPMIFSMNPGSSIDELLAPENIVDFDLRGYGPAEKTTWIQPQTALLVWDPAKRSEITSGQQLFGGYTFQIFRRTGYEALAALDDDGNGVLEAAELTGIRAWFDSNSDAVSSSGEVRDLAELGIVGIKVTANGQDGAHPTCDTGLLLRDGKTLPTWDWMAKPVKD